jgi:zinc finger-like protein
MANAISERTKRLSQHLMAHLEKEETQCMPLVARHLTKSEIHELVGKIMGKRSADTIAQIMTMAVQNLAEADREEMVRYMKQSMAGTFFDRWLLMSGWMASTSSSEKDDKSNAETAGAKRPAVLSESADDGPDVKRRKVEPFLPENQPSTPFATAAVGYGEYDMSEGQPGTSITSQAELEKLIRAIASNPSLTPAQKNTTIQGLRDSVWKSNKRQKEMSTGPPTVVNAAVPTVRPQFPKQDVGVAVEQASAAASAGSARRGTPPALYFRKYKEGKISLVWNADSVSGSSPAAIAHQQSVSAVPLFSAAELAPTYHDGASGAVLGCPHYARSCKLRHPKSGRLYTCRLCCEQQRELPMKDQDEPLDRYAVTEVMCMRCNTLQPAEDRCINPECESRGKPFAKYFCRICHLYDDGSRPIFHCPYCNTCRLGLGLGIDFRHCMRCNACVSLSDEDHHCIPQKLQGSCPICSESCKWIVCFIYNSWCACKTHVNCFLSLAVFQSTEPLRGLKCGHVLHLACFTEYRKGHSYTCPLCMRSMEDVGAFDVLSLASLNMVPLIYNFCFCITDDRLLPTARCGEENAADAGGILIYDE